MRTLARRDGAPASSYAALASMVTTPAGSFQDCAQAQHPRASDSSGPHGRGAQPCGACSHAARDSVVRARAHRVGLVMGALKLAQAGAHPRRRSTRAPRLPALLLLAARAAATPA